VKDVALPDKRVARRSFERAAAGYERGAVLHREVGRRLLEHLDPIRIDPARIVDLGCGPGSFFEPLVTRYPRAEIVGVDFARPMLARAASRRSWWRRAFSASSPRLVCADAEALPLGAASTAFVFSNLALQWCRPEALFAEAARVLSTGGLFLFSTFGPDTLKELRAAFASVDSAPHVHAFIDMHDLGDALVHAGFAEPVMEMEVLTVEYASVEAIARDLKSVGGHNALAARSRGLVGRKRWRRVAEHYESERRGEALPATYEVVYGHAWKVPPKRTVDGRQVIDFVGRGKV
jgi:malonyl-CoA O-methyltransferase